MTEAQEKKRERIIEKLYNAKKELEELQHDFPYLNEWDTLYVLRAIDYVEEALNYLYQRSRYQRK